MLFYPLCTFHCGLGILAIYNASGYAFASTSAIDCGYALGGNALFCGGAQRRCAISGSNAYAGLGAYGRGKVLGFTLGGATLYSVYVFGVYFYTSML